MENRNPMEYKPVFPLLMSMAIPPMISMLIQSLYNIIDSIFVSQLGEEALTAVSLIFPLQNLSLAISCGIGIAMNAFIARHLGAKDDNKASYYATQGIVMSLAHSLLFLIIGLFFIRPFLNMFTTNQNVINYGMQYGMIVVSLVIGQFIHLAIEKMFQATGNMMMPMIMQIFGAVINIILDPILIFGYFGLPAFGVAGAAIATVIGQFSAASLAFVLFKKYNTPEQFAALTEEEIGEEIRSCGLYKSKSKKIKESSRMICENFGGEVPQTLKELTTLPGVGRKTADVVLSNAFNHDAIAVDTHVFRVTNRIGIVNEKNVEKTEFALMDVIPKNRWSHSHHLFIFHGRRMCKARKPECDTCPIKDDCDYYNNLQK